MRGRQAQPTTEHKKKLPDHHIKAIRNKASLPAEQMQILNNRKKELKS